MFGHVIYLVVACLPLLYGVCVCVRVCVCVCVCVGGGCQLSNLIVEHMRTQAQLGA